MTDLHAELAAGDSGCKVCTFIRNLTTIQEVREWKAELALPAKIVPHLNVERALKARGVEVSETSIRRHRRNHAAR